MVAGEWLEWQEIPLQGTVTMKVRVATPNSGKRMRFVIDGAAGPTVTLPNTGGWQTYQTVNAGTFSFPNGTYHTVRIEMIDGDFNLNYWTN
ncbi:carbohydrate-binding domain-containing protein [Paenibacillus sp. GP183]|uniref:carbohydrate-binding domain-containing protein n=1 Tax=Paenibacillus sp. GP183 TaxID=1882751 RepID=UPI00209B3D9E|nr:carbohydrate-binding domain-containing protein [Paenibacillus sp. GP183]